MAHGTIGANGFRVSHDTHFVASDRHQRSSHRESKVEARETVALRGSYSLRFPFVQQGLTSGPYVEPLSFCPFHAAECEQSCDADSSGDDADSH